MPLLFSLLLLYFLLYHFYFIAAVLLSLYSVDYLILNLVWIFLNAYTGSIY